MQNCIIIVWIFTVSLRKIYVIHRGFTHITITSKTILIKVITTTTSGTPTTKSTTILNTLLHRISSSHHNLIGHVGNVFFINSLTGHFNLAASIFDLRRTTLRIRLSILGINSMNFLGKSPKIRKLRNILDNYISSTPLIKT